MRLVFAIAIAAACSAADDETRERSHEPFAPSTDDADAVRELPGRPPAVIVVDDRDKTYLAYAESWEKLDVGRIEAATAIGLDTLVLDLMRTTHRVSQSRVSNGYVLDDITPKRQARFAGYVVDVMAMPQRAVVLASPRANAATVIEVLGLTSSALAVMHRGHLRVLRVDFTPNAGIEAIASSWREVHVKRDALGFYVIGEPWEEGPTDLLVDPDATAQDLVDAIVAKHDTVRVLGLGHRPDPKELAKRDRRGPGIGYGPLGVFGLEAQDVEPVFERARPKLRACYEAALQEDPRAKVDVDVTFNIDSDGKPTAVGLTAPADMLDCIREIVDQLAFPKPRQEARVSQRFTMRP